MGFTSKHHMILSNVVRRRRVLIIKRLMRLKAEKLLGMYPEAALSRESLPDELIGETAKRKYSRVLSEYGVQNTTGENIE